MIDLRSDTVTRPSKEMRQFMVEAAVGDDVFGEDPTVQELEERVATMLGKEAALFVPSGTMANQIGILIHTEPGDEVIVDRQSHIFNYESGAAASVAQVQLNLIDGENGLPSAQQVTAAVRPGHYWEPRTRLLCLENTMNKAGGIVFSVEQLQEVIDAARTHGLATHLDGARLWHASIATDTPLSAFGALFDTVWVALSKALGAPAGSVIAGSSDAIQAARRYRKMLGGGMRQVGILAAAGLFAIDHHLDDLEEDHHKAAVLAKGIAECEAFTIDLESVQSNIVMFGVRDDTAANVLADLKSRRVLAVPFGPTTIRATTHRDVSMADVEQAVDAIQQNASSRNVTATTP